MVKEKDISSVVIDGVKYRVLSERSLTRSVKSKTGIVISARWSRKKVGNLTKPTRDAVTIRLSMHESKLAELGWATDQPLWLIQDDSLVFYIFPHASRGYRLTQNNNAKDRRYATLPDVPPEWTPFSVADGLNATMNVDGYVVPPTKTQPGKIAFRLDK